MSEARAHILSRIRNNIKSSENETVRSETARKRLKSHPKGILPAHANCDGEDRVALFKERLEKVQGVCHILENAETIPEKVTEILASCNEAPIVTIPDAGSLNDIDWSQSPTLEVGHSIADVKCQVALSYAYSAAAETGTLMLLSGPEGPTTLNFLPSTHLVLIKQADIMRHYEEAFDRLRKVWDKDGTLPRCVNLVTGPSRTGDVEHRLILGAHGPLRLHVLVIP